MVIFSTLNTCIKLLFWLEIITKCSKKLNLFLYAFIDDIFQIKCDSTKNIDYTFYKSIIRRQTRAGNVYGNLFSLILIKKPLGYDICV